MEALVKVVLQLHKQWGIAANEETGRSLMQANVNLLYRSTSFYTLSEAARFKLDWFLKLEPCILGNSLIGG